MHINQNRTSFINICMNNFPIINIRIIIVGCFCFFAPEVWQLFLWEQVIRSLIKCQYPYRHYKHRIFHLSPSRFQWFCHGFDWPSYYRNSCDLQISLFFLVPTRSEKIRTCIDFNFFFACNSWCVLRREYSGFSYLYAIRLLIFVQRITCKRHGLSLCHGTLNIPPFLF